MGDCTDACVVGGVVAEVLVGAEALLPAEELEVSIRQKWEEVGLAKRDQADKQVGIVPTFTIPYFFNLCVEIPLG